MSKNKPEVTLSKSPVSKKAHSNKVKASGEKTSDKLNKNASIKSEKNKDGVDVSTPEKNYEFNTKTKIKEGEEIAYKDGNPKNTAFSNLKVVVSKPKK